MVVGKREGPKVSLAVLASTREIEREREREEDFESIRVESSPFFAPN